MNRSFACFVLPPAHAALAGVLLAALLLSGCASRVTLPPSEPVPGVTAPGSTAGTSSARTAREYRVDAASHLYQRNAQRIYPGKLPPLLYAIGVLDVQLDQAGNVIALDWRRVPRHAPEVVAEIERTVHQAAPYPRAVRLGRVVYTDTWLWDESGRFQLDTLSEGQLGQDD